MTEDQWNLFEATYRAEQEKHSGTQPLNSRRRALEAVLTAQDPAQGSAEPVAWREETFGAGKGWYYAEKPWSKDAQPLYAAPCAPHAALGEAGRALNVIRTIALGGWSDHYDQDFGTKDDEYRFDCIREQVERAHAALQPEAPAPVPNSEMLELANSIEGGHVRVHHLDARNEWAAYKTDLVVKALRAASQVHCGQINASELAEQAIVANPYPRYSFPAQNDAVERNRAERYARMIVGEVFKSSAPSPGATEPKP